MTIRTAESIDLPAIVAIYNASIPGRMATADTEPVTVEMRRAWFAEFNPQHRPLWVFAEGKNDLAGWVSFRSFYGRPAYHATVETAVYCTPDRQRRGIGRALLDHALKAAPDLGVRSVLAFVFAHNTPSVALFEQAGFKAWGHLPQVAELDGVERDVAILGKRVS